MSADPTVAQMQRLSDRANVWLHRADDSLEALHRLTVADPPTLDDELTEQSFRQTLDYAEAATALAAVYEARADRLMRGRARL